MLYSCTHMATVGVKGLNILEQTVVVCQHIDRHRCLALDDPETSEHLQPTVVHHVISNARTGIIVNVYNIDVINILEKNKITSRK